MRMFKLLQFQQPSMMLIYSQSNVSSTCIITYSFQDSCFYVYLQPSYFQISVLCFPLIHFLTTQTQKCYSSQEFYRTICIYHKAATCMYQFAQYSSGFPLPQHNYSYPTHNLLCRLKCLYMSKSRAFALYTIVKNLSLMRYPFFFFTKQCHAHLSCTFSKPVQSS